MFLPRNHPVPSHSNELNSVVRRRRQSSGLCGVTITLGSVRWAHAQYAWLNWQRPTRYSESVNGMRQTYVDFHSKKSNLRIRKPSLSGMPYRKKKVRGDHRKRMRRERHVTALDMYCSRVSPSPGRETVSLTSHMSFSTSWHVPWSALITSTSIIDVPFRQQALLGASAG